MEGGWGVRSCSSSPACSISQAGDSSTSRHGAAAGDFVHPEVTLSIETRDCNSLSSKSNVWKDGIRIFSACYHARWCYFTNKLQTMAKHGFLSQYRNKTPSRKQTCEKFHFTHIFLFRNDQRKTSSLLWLQMSTLISQNLEQIIWVKTNDLKKKCFYSKCENKKFSL